MQKSKLPEMIITKKDADRLSEELEFLKQSIYRSDQDGFEASLKGKVRSWVAEVIGQELGSFEGSKEEYLEYVLTALKQLESISLVLAFEPSNMTIKKIFDFLEPNITGPFVLDVKFDQQIIAGAVVSYKGRYRDFSLRRLFNQELSKSRDQIIAILNKTN